MTTYHFSGAVAWNRLGSFVTTGRGVKSVSIKDPATSLTPAGLTQGGVGVTQITSDAFGLFAFTTTDVPGVLINFGLGEFMLYANEVPALAVASSAPTDTAVSTLVTTSTATQTAMDGRFLKVLEGPLDPARYGAVGDGTTVDRVAINNAIAAMSTGQTMRLRPGLTYIVDAQITHKAGITIEGNGATIKVKPSTTPTYNVFQPSSALTIRGLTIDLNKANTTDPGAITQGIGLYCFAASGWSDVLVLEDVRVINGYQPGVRFGTTSAATDPLNVSLSRAMVRGLVVDSCKYGVYIQNCGGISIVSPEISNTTADSIWDNFTRGTQVIGGHIRSAGGHGIVTQYSHGFEANGAEVTAAGNMGIVVGGGSTTLNQARNFRIVNNHVRASVSNGISVDPTKTGSGTTPQPVYGVVSGNVSEANGLHGIYLHNTQYMAVEGNQSIQNTGNASSGGLAMDSKDVAVSGNVLVGNNYGIKFQGTVSGYGSHQIGRNRITGSVTADYYYDSNGADNTTLDLQGSGAPAIAAPVGSTYRRVDGGASTSFYVKESGGVTSSGWVAK